MQRVANSHTHPLRVRPMSWLTDLKLKTKLLSAFCLCALITVVVGVLGQSGISRLYELFENTVSDNLVSIAKVDSVKANVIATNRDFFKAIGLSALKANPEDINAAIQSLKENQAQAETDFKTYRATPLDPDEKPQAMTSNATGPLTSAPPSMRCLWRRAETWSKPANWPRPA
ncbi:MCP four helix bundle domain-containing protein [Pseudomonas sp. W5-36]|uniref:MCP four helix bundle domain-containing protein n=1 Tax=Pseudomonas sp. W5-36 TaxID=3097455 RepID=UPI00397A1F82